MPKILFAILLIPAIAFGSFGFRDASVTNIPIAYTGAGSLLITNIKHANKIACRNNAGDLIRVCYTKADTTACEAGDDWAMEDGDGFAFDDDLVGGSLWIKSPNGVLATGTIWCRVWTRN